MRLDGIRFVILPNGSFKYLQTEALLLAVENATSNSLFQPDWEANRVCVQGMNTIRTSEMYVYLILFEISFRNDNSFNANVKQLLHFLGPKKSETSSAQK